MDLRNLGLWPEGENPFYTADQYAKKLDKDEAKTEAWDAIKNSLIGSLVKSVAGAAALPGDVYAGRTDPMSIEGIERAADLAGFVTLGSYGATKPKGAIGMGGRDKADDAVKGIKAYHGSPHDFDKFDLSKIGTGEGAQAYGHGLYFAEKEGTAKAYRDALSPGAGASPQDIAARLLRSVDGNQDAALAEMRKRIDDAYKRGGTPDTIKPLMEARNIINTQPAKAMGRMYEVNIRANPDDFLDWDKPLVGQPKVVQDALTEKLGYSKAPWPYDGLFGPDKSMISKDAGGEEIYRAIGRERAGNYQPMLPYENKEAASAALREAGIPGIKYLDQGSRAAGDGSRNYVVFDDALIEILRKYGLTALLGLGGAAGAYQAQAPDNGT